MRAKHVQSCYIAFVKLFVESNPDNKKCPFRNSLVLSKSNLIKNRSLAPN